MIILDTNVLSALMQRPAIPSVVRWLDHQPKISIWITSITVFEINTGLKSMPLGKRRDHLFLSFAFLLQNIVQNRVAAFDASAAQQAAELAVARKKAGRSDDLRDTMIAAIAVASHATLATRNTKHFDDLPTPVVNPFDTQA